MCEVCGCLERQQSMPDSMALEEDNGSFGAYQTLANIGDTLRARGFEANICNSIDGRVIELAQEYDRLKKDNSTLTQRITELEEEREKLNDKVERYEITFSDIRLLAEYPMQD